MTGAADRSADSKPSGRATWQRGRLAQQRGQLGVASERLREAARQLRDAGDLEAAAAAELELGNVLIERGRVSEALTWLTASARLFGELGAVAGWCAAELRRGSALWRVGRIDEAQAAVDTGLERCAAAPGLRSAALIAAGEVLRRLGDESGAVARYREALADASAREEPRSQLAAHLALAEVGQRDADAGAEPGDGTAVAALCTSDDDRDRWTLARGRRAVRDPDSLPRAPLGSGPIAVLGDASAALARACAEVAARASDSDRLERAFRGHSLAAQLAQRARDVDLAHGEADRARLAHAAWAAANGPACRAALDGDPDLARLPRLPPQIARSSGEPGAAAAASAALRRVLAASRRLLGAGVERIAEEAIDAAIDLTGAERGFVLVRTAGGELTVGAVRGFVAGELADRRMQSELRSALRAIAERVAQTGEPATAGSDLLEPDDVTGGGRPSAVLVVPLRGRDAIVGSLCVERRLRAAAFDGAAAAVVAELAELVGLALDAARRADELQHAADTAAERNAQLAAELATRDAELAELRAGLAERDAELVELQTERVVRDAELVRAGTELATRHVELSELRTGLAERDAELVRAGTELAKRDAELVELRTERVVRDAELAELRAERAAAQEPAEDLRVRPAIAAIERVLITAAMERAGGNQTVAARLLGLSRFGLQKKLRRRAGAAPAHGSDEDGEQPEEPDHSDDGPSRAR